MCCIGNWVWGRAVIALPSPSAALSQWGLWGVLVPSCHRAPYKLRRCSNHQTWSIVASQTSVLRELGKSQWTNKKFNEQKCQSLRNVSDPSPLTLLSCANTVGNPFLWPCVLIPCTPLLFGMPPAALFRGCSLDGISYLGTGPYFSWDSAGKLIFKKTSSSGEQHFLLLNNRLVGKVPWNLDNKRRKWSPLLSKHISLSNSKKCIAKPLCLSLHTPRTDGTAELDLCQGSSEEWLERLLPFLLVESLTLSKSVLFS